jgi:signal recognition particle subunit SRP54
VTVNEVNRLLVQFDQMRQMMKKLQGNGLFKLMSKLGGMGGGGMGGMGGIDLGGVSSGFQKLMGKLR